MKEPTAQTVNLATELRSGRHYGVFVDDTGSPGLVTPGLHSERKSWVAVLVLPHQIVDVLDQIPKALSVLDGRHRDKASPKTGEIQQKRGDTLNKNLPKPIPQFRSDTKLETMRRVTGEISIGEVRRAAAKLRK